MRSLEADRLGDRENRANGDKGRQAFELGHGPKRIDLRSAFWSAPLTFPGLTHYLPAFMQNTVVCFAVESP